MNLRPAFILAVLSIFILDLVLRPAVYASIQVDENGVPISSTGKGYTPAEKNVLLGHSVLMDPVDCVKRYGQAFCACTELDDGSKACFYQRPATGFYTLAACEAIWGTGHCTCTSQGLCKLDEQENKSNPLACNGQIYFFPGERQECRKSGAMTAFNNCCKSEPQASSACSFSNMASEFGLDDLAMTAVSLGYSLGKEQLCDYMAAEIVNSYISTGAVDAVMPTMMSLFGSSEAQNVATVLQKSGIKDALDFAGKSMLTDHLASSLLTSFNFVSYAYTIYSIYNTFQQMSKCTAGEKILGCKIAKGVCRYVGDRCKMKVFGMCLQSSKQYCCFNSKLALLVHEGGRPQINMGWGSGKSPNCRGFQADEFAKIDFSRIDFSAYAEDLVRQGNFDPNEKVQKALDRFTEGVVNTNRDPNDYYQGEEYQYNSSEDK